MFGCGGPDDLYDMGGDDNLWGGKEEDYSVLMSNDVGDIAVETFLSNATRTLVAPSAPF